MAAYYHRNRAPSPDSSPEVIIVWRCEIGYVRFLHCAAVLLNETSTGNAR